MLILSLILAALPVWQKLEEENREFFRAYYLRLMVKHQIIEYNNLLKQQVELMSQLHSSKVASISSSNGSQISSSKSSSHLDGNFMMLKLWASFVFVQ